MEIRIRETGAIMYEDEFRSYLKEKNGPSYDLLTIEIADTLGVDVLLEGPQQAGDGKYQFNQRAGAEQIDGIWYTKYVLGPVFTDILGKTAQEQEIEYRAIIDLQKADYVRSRRNQKLAETDWRFRSDLTPSESWINYCQALRDITTQSGFPWDIQWPTEPTNNT